MDKTVLNAAGAPRKIVVRMLGPFSVELGGEVISMASPRSQNVWKLFKILASNRGKTLSPAYLTELMWADEDLYYPAKALQNLVYRLRNTLSLEKSGNRDEFVLFTGGSYGLNPTCGIEFDCDRFAGLCDRILHTDAAPEAALALTREAIALYRGDYLEEHASEAWTLPLAGWYRSLFLHVCEVQVKALLALDKPDELIATCERAIAVDPMSELFHERLIEKLIETKQYVRAATQYGYAATIFDIGPGAEKHESLRALGQKLPLVASGVRYDIETALAQMKEKEPATGAFLCDIDVFKQIFRLEMRAAARMGTCLHLGIVTLVEKTIAPPDAGARAMSMLKKSCVSALRRSDAVSQLDEMQVMVLLPGMESEHIDSAIRRITGRFAHEAKDEPFSLEVSKRMIGALSR